jgi:hypothetical protein
MLNKKLEIRMISGTRSLISLSLLGERVLLIHRLVNYCIRNRSILLRPQLMSLIMETRGECDLNSRRASNLPLLVWLDATRDAYRIVISAVEQCPMLFFMNDTDPLYVLTDPLYVLTDTSDYGIGAYLYRTSWYRERNVPSVS